MDVGGGSGELIAAAKEYPGLRGTVFDLPRCAETAKNYLQSVSVSDRVSFLASDFFNTIPATADVIILKSMIHDWNDGGGFGGGVGFHGGGGGFHSSASALVSRALV
jgi:tRNA A58 N-methylase Trm61